MKKTKQPEATSPVFQVDENVSLEEQIARRAHELWHQRGRKEGATWLIGSRQNERFRNGIKSVCQQKRGAMSA